MLSKLNIYFAPKVNWNKPCSEFQLLSGHFNKISNVSFIACNNNYVSFYYAKDFLQGPCHRFWYIFVTFPQAEWIHNTQGNH